MAAEAMDVDNYPVIAENITKTYFYGWPKDSPQGAFTPKSFIDNVELSRRRYNWTDAQTVNYAISSMRGQAYDYIKQAQRVLTAAGRANLLTNWVSFRDNLLGHYGVGGIAKRPKLAATLALASSLPLRDWFYKAVAEWADLVEPNNQAWFEGVAVTHDWRAILDEHIPAIADDVPNRGQLHRYRTDTITTLADILQRDETTEMATMRSRQYDLLMAIYCRSILVDHIPFARTREEAHRLNTAPEFAAIDNVTFFEMVALFDERHNPKSRKSGPPIAQASALSTSDATGGETDEVTVEAVKKEDKKKKKKRCAYCDIPGHDKSKCYKKKRDDKKKEDEAKRVHELSELDTSVPPPAPSVSALQSASGNELRW